MARTQLRTFLLNENEVPVEGEPFWDPTNRRIGFWNFSSNTYNWFRIPKNADGESFIPNHEFDPGYGLRFERDDGTWGDWISTGVNLRANGGYIQYRQYGDGVGDWVNLVPLDDLRGESITIDVGDVENIDNGEAPEVNVTQDPDDPLRFVLDFKLPTGEQGIPGKAVEFQKSATHLQWRYSGQTPADTWKNIVALADITGAPANIVVNSVASSPAGTEPTFVLTGTAPNYTLDITIPEGAPGAGTGDVVGPAGGVADGDLVLYNGNTGKILKGSGKKLADFAEAGHNHDGRYYTKTEVDSAISSASFSGTAADVTVDNTAFSTFEGENAQEVLDEVDNAVTGILSDLNTLNTTTLPTLAPKESPTFTTDIKVEGPAPRISFKETDQTAPLIPTWHIRADSNNFYIQRDANSDGTLETPVPMVLSPAGNTAMVWGNTILHTGNGYTKAQIDTLFEDFEPGGVNYIKQTFTATSGQTVFNMTTPYVPGLASVYLDGILMIDGVDVVTTDGTKVTFAVGVETGRLVTVVAYGAMFEVANAVPLARTVTTSGGLLTGGGTLSGDLTISLTRRDVARVPIYAIGSGTGSIVLNLNNGNIQRVNVTGNITYTISNPPAANFEESIDLILVNPTNGSHTWPASVKWIAGSAPDLSTATKARIRLTTDDAGANWMAAVIYKLTS